MTSKVTIKDQEFSQILNEKVINYEWQNSAAKSKANLRTHTFCEWVNEDLLLNETLEPGFPCRNSKALAS